MSTPRDYIIEEDMTFERVRRLPKRTHAYSVHRQLSWQCQKEIKLFEKDNKVTTFELKRSQTFMKDRLSKLQAIKKQLNIRRASTGQLGRNGLGIAPGLNIQPANLVSGQGQIHPKLILDRSISDPDGKTLLQRQGNVFDKRRNKSLTFVEDRKSLTKKEMVVGKDDSNGKIQYKCKIEDVPFSSIVRGTNACISSTPKRRQEK